jgi:general secretion pathway protein B
MSYILDALRRADAERERGAVPSLQSQQHTIIEDDAAPARPRSLVWVVVALAAAVLVLLAWKFLGGTAPPARVPVEGSITTPAPAPLPALQPAPVLPTTPAPPTANLPAVPPAVGTAAPTATATPAPALQPTAPPPPVAAAPTARTAVDARREPVAPPPKRAGAATTAAPGAAPASAEPRVHSQAELPEEIRRDLPKIVIGGSSYSSAAASRMVMINGQVFHEGDRLAPDLVLERIRLKSAVLAFKGWRYEVLF